MTTSSSSVVKFTQSVYCVFLHLVMEVLSTFKAQVGAEVFSEIVLVVEMNAF